MSSSISVNFAPAIDRSVTTLEAFESPATDQRNPFAGDWPVASMDDHDGAAVAPRHDRPVRSRERNLEVPFPCFAVRSTGLLCTPPGYAGGAQSGPAREATSTTAFSHAPDGQSGASWRPHHTPSRA
jgi:hypothetical protein